MNKISPKKRADIPHLLHDAPARAVGVTKRLWETSDIVAVLEDWERGNSSGSTTVWSPRLARRAAARQDRGLDRRGAAAGGVADSGDGGVA